MREKVVKSPRFPELTERHINKWVAIAKSTGKLLGIGNSLSEVLDKSSSVHQKTVFKVLPHVFVGGIK